jgi:uncharacterized SAM-binding protein YcdF (DUF218 family)
LALALKRRARRVTANYLIWLLIKPSHLIVFAAIAAAVFWRKPLGRRCALAAVGMLLVFGLAPLGALLIQPLEGRFEIPAGAGNVDGIVVLAGSEQRRLSETYSQPQLGGAGDRLTTFLLLANEHPAARLVHSGAHDSGTARQVILGAGVAAGRVVFEDRSRDTCESAPATQALVRPAPDERWLLVTSASHMPRAMACFRAIGWDVVPYPADFRRGANPFSFDLIGNLEDLDLALHEWLGLAYYRLRGYTDDLYPAPSGL